MMNRETQKGAKIVVQTEGIKDYFVTFSQEEFDPADPTNPCVNYPTEKYRSYADCDDQFVRRSFPPDLRPFWTVDNISEASSYYTTRPGEQLEDFGYGDLLSALSTLIGLGPSRLCQLSYAFLIP